MKYLNLTTIFTLLLFTNTEAQSCMNSGTSICTPAIVSQTGFSPTSQNLAPIINGTSQSTTIQFKCFDTMRIAGQLVTIQSLRFDSIENLPPGVCWSSNKSNNTYVGNENGCIKITGNACGLPGQYKLRIKITAVTDIVTLPKVDWEAITGSRYYIRLINSSQNTPLVDTGQTLYFVSYGVSPTCTPGNFSVTLGNNKSVCSGSLANLNATISNGYSPYSYTWSSTGNTLSCNNCSNPSAIITQNSSYSVTVTDANNTTASATITYNVINSGSYQISVNGSTTICQGNLATLNAGASYSSYSWSNGANTPSISVGQSGTYSVTVTSQNGCTFTDNKTITVTPPTISNYKIIPNGPTSYCGPGSLILNAGSGFVNYLWSTGAQTQTISVNQTGNYSVTVLGTDGCTYNDVQAVNSSTSYNEQQICIVSVDQSSGKNVIIWEKSTGLGIDSFKIYKESTIANQFQLIRKQAFGNFSTYIDYSSNPQQQSNRYVITTVDACGESQYSPPHQTIHLTSNLGVNNEVNLIWNSYIGFNSGFYNIFRGSSIQNMQQIAQVASTNLSYTDIFPSTPPYIYQIEVVNPQGCVPSFKVEDYSSSRSNIVQINPTNIENKENGIVLYSYYSSYNGRNIVAWKGSYIKPIEFRLYDLAGKLVYTISNFESNEVVMPIGLYSSLYIAELSTKETVSRKIISIR